MAIAANKVPGVRAVTCFEPELARLSREHNDANVLTLGGRFTDKDSAIAILAVWLDTPFAGGRHAGRVAKVSALEEKGSDAPAR
jgi:ribose 5-phosphate isomerase B